jgi:hypothetical protein
MEGDLTQLKARDYCGLDRYLSVSENEIKKNNKRQISLYESNFNNYKKPTNFSINTRIVTAENNFDFGQKVQFKIPRYGDRIGDMSLEITLPTLPNVGYINTIGYGLIEYIEVEIGGIIIDKHYDIWMDVHDQLMTKPDYRDGVNEMILRFQNRDFTDESFQGGIVVVPLKFWFCGVLSQSFPLIALSHQDIFINVKLKPLNKVWTSDSGLTLTAGEYHIEKAHLLVDYIRLDKLEREYLYKKKRHEYLIKQVQRVECSITENTTKLKVSLENINYPVIELVWVLRNDSNENANDYFDYTATTTPSDDPMISGRITFVEKERLEEMSGKFFRMIQPFKKHSNIPDTYIYMYSFAAKPEYDSQPTGSCNFSELDNVYLHLTLKNSYAQGKIFVFAVNYNVLIIEDGYAWLEKCLSI